MKQNSFSGQYLASLSKDGRLLEEARVIASRILEDDPTLSKEKNAVLRLELRRGKYDMKDYSKII